MRNLQSPIPEGLAPFAAKGEEISRCRYATSSWWRWCIVETFEVKRSLNWRRESCLLRAHEKFEFMRMVSEAARSLVLHHDRRCEVSSGQVAAGDQGDVVERDLHFDRDQVAAAGISNLILRISVSIGG